MIQARVKHPVHLEINTDPLGYANVAVVNTATNSYAAVLPFSVDVANTLYFGFDACRQT